MKHQIIHTLTDLESIDPDTMLATREAPDHAFTAEGPQYIAAQGRRVGRGWIPAVVIATGEQVREAQQALKEEE